MAVEMDHLRTPEEKLQTWNGVTKLFIYSGAAIVITLGLMAVFLL